MKLKSKTDAMSIFKSSREKRLWAWTFAVFVAIFSTLFIGQPLANLFRNQDVQAVVFMLVMILVGATIIIHALNKKWGKSEVIILLGIVSVYTMLFLRLGLSERSHLMEYSVLAIFVHRAFVVRFDSKHSFLKPGFYAFVLSVFIGVLDEFIQIFIPDRVFDPEDILFNTLAISMALGFALLFSWIRNRKQKSKILNE